MHLILVINPGSTSTKVALYQDENSLWSTTISYTKDKVAKFEKVIDQLNMRRDDIKNVLKERGVDLASLSAVVGRGGSFKPLASGTYRIDEEILNDIHAGNVQAEHISNIGPLLADELASKVNKPAYFVDPVSVDEFEPVARISGIPELERRSLVHALNIKATAYRFSRDHKRSISECNLIVAHLGGGISICPILKGRIIDVNNANEEGPFSPERSGALPVSSLAKLCYSGKFTYSEMKKHLVGNGGLIAYLGTSDTREVEKCVKKGNRKAKLIYQAMAYQISKEIGAMATVLSGKVDAILLTGGMAYSSMLSDWIRERVDFLAPVYIYAGENEMESMALGALRVLVGDEKAKGY